MVDGDAPSCHADADWYALRTTIASTPISPTPTSSAAIVAKIAMRIRVKRYQPAPGAPGRLTQE